MANLVVVSAFFSASFALFVAADSTSVTQQSSGALAAAARVVGVVAAEGAAAPANATDAARYILFASEAASAANAAAINAAVAAQAASAAAEQAAREVKAIQANTATPAGMQAAALAAPPAPPAQAAGAGLPLAAPGAAAAQPTPTTAAVASPPSAPIVSRWATLLAGLSFAVLVKTMCMASNVLVQLSPFPQVKRWELRGCTAEADPAPYVSIAFGGWQWCYYGMFAYLWTQRSGFLILVQSNFLGAGLGSYYTYAFYKHCSNGEMGAKLRRYLNGVACIVLFQVCALASLPAQRALFLTGLVSSFCGFLGAMSMLVTVPAVMELRSSRPIPGPIVTANLFSGIVWCLCGWILADPLVMVPNVFAVMASGICIYLKFVFPSDEEADSLLKDVHDVEEQPFYEMVVSSDKLKALESIPLAWELGAVKPRSTFGPPKGCEEMLSEDGNFEDDSPRESVPIVDCYGGTGGTW